MEGREAGRFAMRGVDLRLAHQSDGGIRRFPYCSWSLRVNTFGRGGMDMKTLRVMHVLLTVIVTLTRCGISSSKLVNAKLLAAS